MRFLIFQVFNDQIPFFEPKRIHGLDFITVVSTGQFSRIAFIDLGFSRVLFGCLSALSIFNFCQIEQDASHRFVGVDIIRRSIRDEDN